MPFFFTLKYLRRLIILIVLGLIIYIFTTFLQVILTSGSQSFSPSGAVVVFSLGNSNKSNSSEVQAIAQSISSVTLGNSFSVVVIAGINSPSIAQALSSFPNFKTPLVQEGGTSLYQSTALVSQYLHKVQTTQVLLLSYRYDMLLTGAMLSSEGLQVTSYQIQGAPASISFGTYFSETVELALGRIVGYSLANSIFNFSPV